MIALERKHWLLIFSLALLAGWFGTPPNETSNAVVQAKRDVWALPQLPIPFDATSQAMLVAGSPMWGPEPKAVVSDAPPPDTRWRLAGVYGSGKSGGALVLFEDPSKPPLRLKVGGRLPDDQVIESVEGNQVCIRIKKKLNCFGVERRE